jgi:Flp pilus assembly pilin Flp
MKQKSYFFKEILGQTILEFSLIIVVLVLVIVSVFPDLRAKVADVFDITTEVLETGNIDLINPDFGVVHTFNDSSSWEINSNDFSVNNGVITNNRTGISNAFVKGYNGTDYSVDIETAHLQTGNGYGIWFRADSDDISKVNGYTFQFDPGFEGGEFIIRKWVNGREEAPLARVAAEGYNWNDPHNVKLNVVGDTFTALIDGETVLTGQDSTYASGGTGIRTWDGTQATFENFTVSDNNPTPP